MGTNRSGAVVGDQLFACGCWRPAGGGKRSGRHLPGILYMPSHAGDAARHDHRAAGRCVGGHTGGGGVHCDQKLAHSRPRLCSCADGAHARLGGDATGALRPGASPLRTMAHRSADAGPLEGGALSRPARCGGRAQRRRVGARDARRHPASHSVAQRMDGRVRVGLRRHRWRNSRLCANAAAADRNHPRPALVAGHRAAAGSLAGGRGVRARRSGCNASSSS